MAETQIVVAQALDQITDLYRRLVLSDPADKHQEVLTLMRNAREKIQEATPAVLERYKDDHSNPEFVAFFWVSRNINVAIQDLENALLGSIVDRMRESKDDIIKAKDELQKNAERLKKISEIANAISKALEYLVKAAALVL